MFVPANALFDGIFVAIVHVFSRLLNPADEPVFGLVLPVQGRTTSNSAVFMGNTNTGCRRVWMVDGIYRQCLARTARCPCTDSASIDLDDIRNAHYSNTSFPGALPVFRRSCRRQPDAAVAGFYGFFCCTSTAGVWHSGPAGRKTDHSSVRGLAGCGSLQRSEVPSLFLGLWMFLLRPALSWLASPYRFFFHLLVCTHPRQWCARIHRCHVDRHRRTKQSGGIHRPFHRNYEWPSHLWLVMVPSADAVPVLARPEMGGTTKCRSRKS